MLSDKSETPARGPWCSSLSNESSSKAVFCAASFSSRLCCESAAMMQRHVASRTRSGSSGFKRSSAASFRKASSTRDTWALRLFAGLYSPVSTVQGHHRARAFAFSQKNWPQKLRCLGSRSPDRSATPSAIICCPIQAHGSGEAAPCFLGRNAAVCITPASFRQIKAGSVVSLCEHSDTLCQHVH